MLGNLTDEQPVQYSRLVNGFPVFYGWMIIAVAVFSLSMTGAGQSFIFSLFVADMTAALNTSTGVISTLYTGATLIGSATMPWIGRRLDTLGARRMIVIISVLLGLSCMIIGAAQNLWMLAIGLTLARILGAGGLALTAENSLNQWWRRRRGMAIGLSNMLFAIAGVAILPNLVNWLINAFGWRFAYQGIGLIVLVLLLPIGYIFVRDRPEQFGLEPDGAENPPPAIEMVSEMANPEVSWTLSQAIRTPIFWSVSLGIGALAMFSTGLLFHQVAIFADNGLSSTAAAATFVPIALAMAIFGLLSGMLLDRLPVRVVLTLALFIQAASLVLAPFVTSALLAVLFGLLVGSAAGLMRTLSGSIWAIYFGRLHLGSISGTARSIVITCAALGSMIFGVGRDLTGSYTSSLIISAAVASALALLALSIKEPQRS